MFIGCSNHDSKEMEPAYVSTNRRMNDENMVYIDNKIWPISGEQWNLQQNRWI